MNYKNIKIILLITVVMIFANSCVFQEDSDNSKCHIKFNNKTHTTIVYTREITPDNEYIYENTTEEIKLAKEVFKIEIDDNLKFYYTYITPHGVTRSDNIRATFSYEKAEEFLSLLNNATFYHYTNFYDENGMLHKNENANEYPCLVVELEHKDCNLEVSNAYDLSKSKNYGPVIEFLEDLKLKADNSQDN